MGSKVCGSCKELTADELQSVLKLPNDKSVLLFKLRQLYRIELARFQRRFKCVKSTVPLPTITETTIRIIIFITSTPGRQLRAFGDLRRRGGDVKPVEVAAVSPAYTR
jgi:hypothetical protein